MGRIQGSQLPQFRWALSYQPCNWAILKVGLPAPIWAMAGEAHRGGVSLSRLKIYKWNKGLFLFHAMEIGGTLSLGHEASLWLGGKESSCQCRSFRFGPWVTKILWRRKWHHCSILAWRIPWKRSLVGYSPWGHTRVRHNLTTKQQPRLNQPFWFSFVPGPGCWVLFNFANFWGIYSYLN